MGSRRTTYAGYLEQLEHASLHDVEVRSVSPRALDILHVVQTGGRNDPENEDYILVLPRSPVPRGRFEFGSGRFEASPTYGTVLIEPPGVACSYDLPDNAHIDVLAVSLCSERVRRTLAELSRTGPPDLAPIHERLLCSEVLVRLVEELWAELSNGEPNGDLYGDGAVLSLVGAMMQLAGRPSTKPKRLPKLHDPSFQRAIDHVQANLHRNLRLDEIAAAAGLSTSSIARMFRRELGCSPIQHVIRLRLERAAEYLRSGTASVTEVSAAVGYENPQYFATLFRRWMGVTPTEFRRSSR